MSVPRLARLRPGPGRAPRHHIDREKGGENGQTPPPGRAGRRVGKDKSEPEFQNTRQNQNSSRAGRNASGKGNPLVKGQKRGKGGESSAGGARPPYPSTREQPRDGPSTRMRERAPNKTKQKNKNKTQKARGTSTREAGAVAGPVLQKQPLAQITKKKKKKKKGKAAGRGRDRKRQARTATRKKPNFKKPRPLPEPPRVRATDKPSSTGTPDTQRGTGAPPKSTEKSGCPKRRLTEARGGKRAGSRGPPAGASSARHTEHLRVAVDVGTRRRPRDRSTRTSKEPARRHDGLPKRAEGGRKATETGVRGERLRPPLGDNHRGTACQHLPAGTKRPRRQAKSACPEAGRVHR
jgi:hypothetical protein